MAKRKKKNDSDGIAPSTIWKGVKILLLLLVGYALGWNFGYVSGQEDGRSQANSSSGTESSSSPTDDYGRSPGHPHYGHNHS